MRDDTAARFFARFAGLDRAHGETRILPGVDAKGKQNSQSGTEHMPLTIPLVQKHLDGEIGVGMNPLRDDGTVSFGAIDIDVYKDFNIFLLADVVAEYQLPLIVCRTKSGGAHLYCVTSEPVSGELMRGKLMEWAVILGYAGVEVYPKQTRYAGPMDYGSWINLPFQNADMTERYCVLPQRQEIVDVDEFLDHCDTMAQTAASLAAVELPKAAQGGDLFADGPPCLVSLTVRGPVEDYRNNFLFNVCVLMRKKYPDDWQERVDTVNNRYVSPPLGSKEVQTIVKHAASDKNYFYRCNEPPICTNCNRQICLTRPHGVGDAKNDPGIALGALEMLATEPPIWMIPVNGKRIALSTAELKDQGRFATRCIEELRIWPRKVKETQWAQLVREKLEKADVIEAPPEARSSGQVMAYLERYLIERPAALTRDDLARQRPWTDPETGDVHFRGPHFQQYLEQNRVRISAPRLWQILRDAGAKHDQHNIKGRNVQVWIIKGLTTQTEDFAIPPLSEGPV